jgi:hypothetical protein
MAGVAYDPEQVEVTDLLQAICDAGDDGRHHYRAEVVMVVPAPDALSL